MHSQVSQPSQSNQHPQANLLTLSNQHPQPVHPVPVGLGGTVVPIVFVIAIVLVLACLVSAVMRWAATRSVGNAVIQEQLLDLTRQVEQLQGRTEG